ncbi:hypothetical protein CQW23_13536 [Capsicum baccatum]|uniref:Uncharacterized protein n=1 Tax=Capsicum baccatum TaxID=33114 RepID=A0A2G2WGK0_CAPBA|nr:hypothetical protein CQW23_13536 [Capsicum baccatum]
MSDCDRRRYKVLIGAKRIRLHGESDNWKKFPIPTGFESPMSFTLQKVKNNEKARKSMAVGESEQDPSQAASTSTIIGIGKLKSSIRCWPWILDDHVDHIEEDFGCETDKKEDEVSNLMILRYRNATELELVIPHSMYHGHYP